MTTVDIPISEATSFKSTATTTNYSTDDTFQVGENNAFTYIMRGWIKPNFTSIPAGSTFVSSTLKIVPAVDRTSNARTMYIHRCLQNIVAGQATWDIFSTGNNWGTGGASNSVTDYDGAVVIGSYLAPASPVIGEQISIPLDQTELQKLYDGTYTNNGLVLFMATQTNDLTTYRSPYATTEAYRPYITIEYTSGGVVFIPGAMWF